MGSGLQSEKGKRKEGKKEKNITGHRLTTNGDIKSSFFLILHSVGDINWLSADRRRSHHRTGTKGAYAH